MDYYYKKCCAKLQTRSKTRRQCMVYFLILNIDISSLQIPHDIRQQASCPNFIGSKDTM